MKTMVSTERNCDHLKLFEANPIGPMVPVAECLQCEIVQLRAALGRMDKMHEMMMKKINHKASFYDAACLREMNEAPIQANRALHYCQGVNDQGIKS